MHDATPAGPDHVGAEGGPPSEGLLRPERASLLSRLVARLVDVVLQLFVLLVLVLAGTLVLSLLWRDTSLLETEAFLAERTWGVLGGLYILVWDVLFLAARGATPGKNALNIRVTTADDRPLGLRGAVLRTVTLLVPGMLPFVGDVLMVVMPASVLWGGPDQRGWHDRVGATRVVRGPRPPVRYSASDPA